jgi:hypothetical protein
MHGLKHQMSFFVHTITVAFKSSTGKITWISCCNILLALNKVKQMEHS